MSRLPQPGGDSGNWGEILNDYLSQSLAADGTLKIGIVQESKLSSAVQTKLNDTSVADGSVTTAKLADGAVTNAKLATVGQANGIATLDANAQLLDAQVPTRLGESELSSTYARRLRRVDFPSWSARSGHIHPEPSPVSLSAHNAATAVSSPIVVGLDDPRVYVSPRVYPSVSGSATTTDYTASVISDDFQRNVNAGGEFLPWALEIITDSLSFEVVYQASSAVNYKLFEDGLAHTSTETQISNGGGGQYRMQIKPVTRRLRHFRLETTSMFPAHLVFSRTDTVYAPPVSRPRVGFVGDSYIQQSGIAGIAWTVGQLLGWEPIVDGDGGSGYLAAPTFRTRLAGMLATSPDALVICGGINDGTTGLSAELDTYFSAIVTARPEMPVFVCGPWAPSDTSRASQTSKFTLIKEAAESYGFHVLDNFTLPWITGTGKESLLVGDGNADIMTATDGTHATATGRTYLATRLAESINSKLPII